MKMDSKAAGVWGASKLHGMGSNSRLLKTWYRTYRFWKSGTV